jgi:hypothetical protein
MTQVGELVTVSLGLSKADDEIKCPFSSGPPEKDVALEKENVGNDDVRHRQANSGGALGENLERVADAAWGRPGTWNRRFPPPRQSKAQRRRDTTTDATLAVSLELHTGGSSKRDYPWKVAAHHLIPGNASLEKSALFKRFMKKGGKVQAGDRKFKIRTNIGYNVNGAHNGVWLPGNYGIRKKPVGVTWSTLSNGSKAQRTWCFEYAKAVMSRARGQFHDTHVDYSDNVLAALNKLSSVMIDHMAVCEKECKKKCKGEVDPPYRLKTALYTMSRTLKSHVRGQPPTWRFPWYTSDRFKADLMLLSKGG